MIFISKNSDGVPAWKLILQGKKIVTRRLKPCVVGKDYAVCPGRGKFQVCRIKVISCVEHTKWREEFNRWDYFNQPRRWRNFMDKESKKEGFLTWHELADWFINKKITINKTYRIEFKVIT